MANTTRNKLIRLLEQNMGVFLSGERIAAELGISRTAIWKTISSLKDEGYEIAAVRNRGYCLAESTDILSSSGVARYLDEVADTVNIEVFPEIDSTNTYLMQRAISGAPEGSVVIAGAQSAGRGRRGKSFISPSGSGVYMSFLLRPHDMLPEEAVRITTMAAVCVCETIEDISGNKTDIKWVNDVYIDGKKVCGILTEASFGTETGELEYVIVGIGINVYSPDGGFDASIREIAGAVFTEKCSDAKNRLASGVIRRFMNYYELIKIARTDDQFVSLIVNEYRRRSIVTGKNISVLKGDKSVNAFAEGIDDECHLIVRYADGSREVLSSGEVSIRL